MRNQASSPASRWSQLETDRKHSAKAPSKGKHEASTSDLVDLYLVDLYHKKNFVHPTTSKCWLLTTTRRGLKVPGIDSSDIVY